MTPEQKKQLAEIGKKVRELFPDMYGWVRFNLNPSRKSVNVNIADTIEVEQSLKLDPNRQEIL